MTEIVDIGKISSRGQIAIPSDIREQMGLHEGEKVLFVLQDDTLVMKKVSSMSFSEVTAPLRKANKKIKESEVEELIDKMRKR